MKFTRMMAILLTLCLALICLPMAVGAEENVIASGTCGENVTWVLTEDGTLTISGNGAMANYGMSVGGPWSEYNSSIHSLIIGDGVTRIGNSAFSGCTSLTGIDFSNSITSIGYYAFYNCTGLTGIDLPDGLTSIGYSAFWNCRGLTSIELPDGVTSIGGAAFRNCVSLISIDIPESVTSIGDDAFGYCHSLASVEIPDGVTEIGMNMFTYCYVLTSITIPARVEYIFGEAFSHCTGLTEIYFEGSAPQFLSSPYGGVFEDVTATCYYPQNDPTWTADVMQDYGGNLTWVAVDPCAKGHSYHSDVTAPTCTEQGYTTYTCTRCGDSYADSYVDATGHTYREWYVVTEATCDEDGEERHDCACGHYEAREIEAFGHTFEDGYCTVCGASERMTGDLTGDGEIDIFDANLIVAYYNGTTELTAEQQKAADVNGDGEIDIFDANLVVSFYNGTIAAFPIEE